MQICSKLAQAVAKSGRLKKEIAAEAGISAVALSKYLNGVVVPKTATLTKLANALNVPLSYFYGTESESSPLPSNDESEMWKARALKAEAKLAHLARACSALGKHVSALGITVEDFSKIISS